MLSCIKYIVIIYNFIFWVSAVCGTVAARIPRFHSARYAPCRS